MGWIDSVKGFPKEDVLIEPWKQELINFLYDKQVIKFGNYTLKSGRKSKSFANFGDINDGIGMAQLSKAYAESITSNFKEEFKTILGPSYKGVPLAVGTSMALATKGRNVNFTFDRKEEKAYGEATGTSKAEAAKKIFVGYIPQDDDKVLLIDDVISTGLTKDEEIQKLKSVANVKMVGLEVGLNRQEMDENGNDPFKELSKKYEMPVHAMLNMTTEVVPFLYAYNKIDNKVKRGLTAYARAYGTEETKPWCRDIRVVQRDKGIIPACDIPIDKFEDVLEATKDIDQVVAYKIGFEALLGGLDTWVKTARKHTDKPLIYDHQKGMTDIPDTGKRFAEIMKTAGVDAIIGFPHSGPSTQLEWIHAAYDQDLDVIMGGEMTHPRFLKVDGGYIDDDAVVKSYLLSAKAGINSFVMPGNKPLKIKLYKELIEKELPEIEIDIFSPGLVAQDGKISESTKMSKRWKAIVGRGVYGDVEKTGKYFTQKEMRDAAFQHVSQL
jgi:orotate phosphoribosyltransferase